MRRLAPIEHVLLLEHAETFAVVHAVARTGDVGYFARPAAAVARGAPPALAHAAATSPASLAPYLTPEAVALARRNASVFALSARDLFCSTSDAASAECGPTLQPLPVVGYLDGDHLNKAGALFLWPYLCDAFERFGFFGPADEAAPAGERVIVY